VDAFRANAAAILNLTPDHLDRYESHEAYGAAKARIFATQVSGDAAVVNADDEGVLSLCASARVPTFGFSLHPSREHVPLAGLAVPVEGGFNFDFGSQPRFSLTNPALRGAHNLQNAMAASLLAFSRGVGPEAIQRGLDRYPGLPHRLESVRRLNGVEWVNDSKGTNVDSTVVALRAFERERVWLIAGGKGKGAPYAPLKEAGRGRVVGVLTIGKDAPNLERELKDSFPIIPCETLDRAVVEAFNRAVDGDVVLLSPACASYDQFKNFEDRGDTFRRLVMTLAFG
jgi:UDP-N-acetylmuramoylalanine--D-glutamate ligase